MKDIAASRAFYEKLGFSVFGGDQDQNWLILQNGAATIGLFQGMFERNTLTFNPGWDTAANTLAEFTDVRELQRRQKAGIEPALEADESGQGRPASWSSTRTATRSSSTSTSDRISADVARDAEGADSETRVRSSFAKQGLMSTLSRSHAGPH